MPRAVDAVVPGAAHSSAFSASVTNTECLKEKKFLNISYVKNAVLLNLPQALAMT